MCLCFFFFFVVVVFFFNVVYVYMCTCTYSFRHFGFEALAGLDAVLGSRFELEAAQEQRGNPFSVFKVYCSYVYSMCLLDL